MKIEFDRDKDALNRRKHNVSLGRARLFEMESALVVEDDRADYGEVRYAAIGRIDRGVFVLVFTWRHDVVRVISLRKAEKSEREFYVAHR